jgi:hypothetical protein
MQWDISSATRCAARACVIPFYFQDVIHPRGDFANQSAPEWCVGGSRLFTLVQTS